MNTRMAIYAAVLGIMCSLAGCGGSGKRPEGFVNWFGTHSIEDGVELKISTVGMSQIRYEMRHLPTDRVMISDVASDTRGWFLVWDEDDRLWAHWNDGGTVVWVPRGNGRFEKHRLTRDSPLIREMPPSVTDNLPDWTRQSLGL